MHFNHVTRPPNLTESVVQELYQNLLMRTARLFMALPEWLDFIQHWNEIKAYLEGESARRNLAEASNALDPEVEARMRWFREKIIPLATQYDAEARKVVLNAPIRKELENKLGKQVFNIWQAQETSAHPVNIPQQIKIGELYSDYSRIKAQAEFEFGGEKLTLTQLQAKLIEKDENTRQAAFEKLRLFWAEHAQKMDAIYSEMVTLRQQMADNIGLPNFIPLGYTTMNRSDYTPREVKHFRDEVKKHCVPVYAKLRAQHAKQLGALSVKPWNRDYYPGITLPSKIVPAASQLEKAAALFEALHPKLAEHFRRMQREGLIDLENRKGKRAGAFCITMPDEQKVRLFCNSTGDADDISALTHESGHAFQAWESQWIDLVELQSPTYEACEIHSMGMEFLALDHLEMFFNAQDADKFKKERLIQTVTYFPYICLVDEFQHNVYSNPAWTAQKRAECWASLWDEYLPGDDFSGLEAYKARLWQRQLHIYASPFYYIDYALAETCALQLWLLRRRDPKHAMDVYTALCKLGGTQSFLAMIGLVGLEDPFKPGVLAPLMAEVSKELFTDNSSEIRT